MSTQNLQPDPISQQLANVQENKPQAPSGDAKSQQLPGSKSPKRTTQWTGFTGKTLWDWLNLLGGAILIPVVIGAATLWFSSQQHASDQAIALDQQQQVVFQTSEDNIKDLLLTKGLETSKPGDEVRIVARAEILAALRQLDKERKGLLIQFLDEANLIAQRPNNDVIIYLWGADLSEADLSGVIFHNVNLSGTILRGANLQSADLHGANLSQTSLRGASLEGADLHGANLHEADLVETDFGAANLHGADLSEIELGDNDFTSADLSGANLTYAMNGDFRKANLKGATMPDKSKHP
jgi:uncharacterized protein YjbI with pentapeptide repeats